MKVWKFSKYIVVALVLTIGAGIWAAYGTAEGMSRSAIFPMGEAEQAERFQKHQAEYIWPTSQYDRIAFVNLEKDYYAVQRIVHMENYSSYYRIVDRNDQTIKDLSEYEIEFVWDEDSISGKYSRDYVTACDGTQRQWYVIDRDTLEVYPAGTNFITMHPETGCYMPIHTQGQVFPGYQVRSPEGEILLESDVPIRMASDPGYVIRMPEDQELTQIVDMKSGEVIYESRGTEVIEDYDHGFIVIHGTAPGFDREGNPAMLSCVYLMGPDFKPALDGRLFFSKVNITDQYIYGEAIIDGYLEGEQNRNVADGEWNITVVVYSHEGKLLFEGKKGDAIIDPIRGGTLAVCRRNEPDQDWKYVYVKLTEGGAVS